MQPKTEMNPAPEFLHKASLLIPAEFAETKTAAGRRRMWRTWLDGAAGADGGLEDVSKPDGPPALVGAEVTRLKLKVDQPKTAVHLPQECAKGAETLLSIAVKNRRLRSASR
jgi:hypothetical protein